MSIDIRNLTHVERDVGQHIKSTKKHFIWEFLLEGKPHKIELYDSRLSGKKKLIKDGQVWKEVQEDIAFSKSFEIGKHACTIIQHGEKYELRIDNQSFNHIMDLEKNKVFFINNSNPTSTTYTAKPMVTENKMGFGMGNLTQIGNSRPSGLFNFAIKPVVPGNNQNMNSRRFTEMPGSSGFGNLESKSNKNVSNNSGNNNVNILLDFTSPSINQPIESKTNTNSFNILDSLDFSQNTPVITNNIQNDLFDMTQSNQSNQNNNNNFNQMNNNNNFNLLSNNNNTNSTSTNQFNTYSNNLNQQLGFNSPGILNYPQFDNPPPQNNYNNNNSRQSQLGRDPLADLFN